MIVMPTAGRSGLPKLQMLAIVGCLIASACANLDAEEGRLPEAMRQSITALSAKGYPDLTKIPDAPKNMATQATWSSLEAGLVRQGEVLARSPMAKAPTKDETNLGWADAARASLTNDPRAAPIPSDAAGNASELAWAAQAKAELEADLARLPPP